MVPRSVAHHCLRKMCARGGRADLVQAQLNNTCCHPLGIPQRPGWGVAFRVTDRGKGAVECSMPVPQKHEELWSLIAQASVCVVHVYVLLLVSAQCTAHHKGDPRSLNKPTSDYQKVMNGLAMIETARMMLMKETSLLVKTSDIICQV